MNTQLTHQQHEDPYLAIVIDPVRTSAAGKVEIGAFRTYPANHSAHKSGQSGGPGSDQVIPLDKIEDFGVHSSQYYSLDVSFFKSSVDRRLLDMLWHQYWVNTLASSGLISNMGYTVAAAKDLGDKLGQMENAAFMRIGTEAGGMMNYKGLDGGGG